MPGPPPSEKRSRARDTPTREVIRSDGKIGGPPLPPAELALPRLPKEQWADPKVPEHEQWHPMTVRWWENWRHSPQATRMTTEVDWDYMLDTALMHHVAWMSGGKNSERFGEIRVRVAQFGATYADRLRLRLEIEVPEEYAVGNGAKGNENVTSLQDRRKRIANG